MGRSRAPEPTNRAGIWYLVKRVPKAFQAFDRRVIVRTSTQIAVADDPRGVHARPVVAQLYRDLENYWLGLRDGQANEAARRYTEAQARARRLGLPYHTAEELAAGSIDDIVRRFELLLERRTLDDEQEVAAVAGGEPRPRLLVSQMLTAYEDIQSTALLAMSEKQRHKWRLPKQRAINNLIEVLKRDLELTALTRSHALTFRRWWKARVEAEGLDIATANKDIGHLSKMLTAIELQEELGIRPVFVKLRLAGEIDRQGKPLERTWVQKHILADGALDGLNEQARHIVLLMASPIGMRPSEICNLDATTIRLDAKLPHIVIEPRGRVLKTPHSAREIPLVGMALDIMRRNPAGFPRYRDNADSHSAAVNKYLRENKLLPDPETTAYGLRHMFEDELTAVEAPEKVVASMMGHKWHRPKYGKGPSLAQKARWLHKIALTPPSHFGPREQSQPESSAPAAGRRRRPAQPRPRPPAG